MSSSLVCAEDANDFTLLAGLVHQSCADSAESIATVPIAWTYQGTCSYAILLHMHRECLTQTLTFVVVTTVLHNARPNIVQKNKCITALL